jgi:acetyl esterase/lipase
MSATPAPTTEWAGPVRFLPPPEPRVLADDSRRYEGITYAAAPGYRPLQLDVWVPAVPAPPPLVVWIHGGAWMFGDRRYLPETLRPNQLFEELVAAGLAVATIDYRHSLEAHFPAQLHDAKAAIRYLRAHADVLGIDTGRIGVWGESAGGHLAALVGLTGQHPELEGAIGVLRQSSAVDAVVDWYGPADLALQPREDRAPQPIADLPPELSRRPRSYWPAAETSTGLLSPALSRMSRRLLRRSCSSMAQRTLWCRTTKARCWHRL